MPRSVYNGRGKKKFSVVTLKKEMRTILRKSDNDMDAKSSVSFPNKLLGFVLKGS